MALTQKALRTRRHLVSGPTAHYAKPMLTKFRLQSLFHLGEMAVIVVIGVIGDVLYICNKIPFAIWWNLPGQRKNDQNLKM